MQVTDFQMKVQDSTASLHRCCHC